MLQWYRKPHSWENLKTANLRQQDTALPKDIKVAKFFIDVNVKPWKILLPIDKWSFSEKCNFY